MDAKYSSVEDFVSLCSIEERITAFWRKIGISNIGHENDIILESCSK